MNGQCTVSNGTKIEMDGTAIRKGQKVAGLVRLSLSSEKWVEGIYEGEAIVGESSDGRPISGHRIRTADGLIRYARKCAPIEKCTAEIEKLDKNC